MVEVLCRVVRNLPSTPEMVKDTLEKNKEVEVVLEALTPSLLKSCPVVVNKIQKQQLQVPLDEVQTPSPGHRVLLVQPQYTGVAGRFVPPVMAETVGVRIGLAPAHLGCRGG